MSFNSSAEAVAALGDSVDLLIGLEEIIDLPINNPLPDFSISEIEELINDALGENCENGAPVSSPILGSLLKNNQDFTSSMLEPLLEQLLEEKKSDTTSSEPITIANILKEEPVPCSSKVVVGEVKIPEKRKCEEPVRQSVLEKKPRIENEDEPAYSWKPKAGGREYIIKVDSIIIRLPAWWSDFSQEKKTSIEKEIQSEIRRHGADGILYVEDRYCQLEKFRLKPLCTDEVVYLGDQRIKVKYPTVRWKGLTYNLPISWHGYPEPYKRKLVEVVLKNESRGKPNTLKWGRVFSVNERTITEIAK